MLKTLAIMLAAAFAVAALTTTIQQASADRVGPNCPTTDPCPPGDLTREDRFTQGGVEAFPSHHVDTMRGLTDVSDESDMYPPFQQKEVRAVMEGYIGKPNSNPTIVLVSTPKAPSGLMQQIELEADSLYHKLFFDYHYGLQGPYPIYSEEQIQKARLSPEFGREYELQYLGLVGNVFSQASIENCQKIQNNPENINKNAKKSIWLWIHHMEVVTSLLLQAN
jgi:hypothetical protein